MKMSTKTHQVIKEEIAGPVRSQLRRIIEEEIAKVTSEGRDDFYREKWNLLQKILIHVEKIGYLLDDLTSNERMAPGGDESEIEALHNSLSSFEEEVSDLNDAVEAML